MPITLNKVIIHEVIKEAGSTGSDHFLSESVLPINGTTEFLVEELNKSFGRVNIYYGQLEEDEAGHVFRDEFRAAELDRLTEDAFIHFTKKATIDLARRIDAIPAAKGGYLVFCDFISREVRFIGAFLVRDTQRVLFKQKTAGFEVQQMENVDTDKLSMACRIHLKKFKENEHGYLQFIKNNQAVVSEYFLKWIAAVQSVSNRALTDLLVDVIQDIGLGTTPEGVDYTDVDDFYNAFTTYIRNSPGASVNLRNLGQYFYGDEEKIVNHIIENDIDLDTDFRAHRAALNKLYRLTFRRGGVEVKFTRGDWDRETVRVAQNRIVIDDADLASEIMREFGQP